MLKMCDGCKDGRDTDQDGSSVAQNGAALAPFRANGAHPSYFDILAHVWSCTLLCFSVMYS